MGTEASKYQRLRLILDEYLDMPLREILVLDNLKLHDDTMKAYDDYLLNKTGCDSQQFCKGWIEKINKMGFQFDSHILVNQIIIFIRLIK